MAERHDPGAERAEQRSRRARSGRRLEETRGHQCGHPGRGEQDPGGEGHREGAGTGEVPRCEAVQGKVSELNGREFEM